MKLIIILLVLWSDAVNQTYLENKTKERVTSLMPNPTLLPHYGFTEI